MEIQEAFLFSVAKLAFYTLKKKKKKDKNQPAHSCILILSSWDLIFIQMYYSL